ncbi:MAG: ROK family protein [Bdellovibrionales bacterium]
MARHEARGSYEGFLKALAEFVGQCTPSSAKLVRVCVGLDGVVDPRKGTVSCSYMPVLTNQPFAADLSQAVGVPVSVTRVEPAP